MKVIEPGRAKKKWSLCHRCTGWGYQNNGCDALLELEIDDLRYLSGQNQEAEISPVVSFKCVCCGVVTDLGINDWPKDYKSLREWTTSWYNG